MPFYDYTSSSVIFLRFQEDVFWLTASGLEDLNEGRPLSIKSLPPRTHRHPTSTLRHSPPRSGDRGPSSLPSRVRGVPDLWCRSFSCKLLLRSNLRREGGGRPGGEPAAATCRLAAAALRVTLPAPRRRWACAPSRLQFQATPGQRAEPPVGGEGLSFLISPLIEKQKLVKPP